MTDPLRYIVSFRFVSGGFMIFYAWQAIVIGVLPWFGLEGLPTRTEIRLEGIQSFWVGYSALVAFALFMSLAYGRSKPRAVALMMMSAWYLLYLAVISTPVVTLLYAGNALMSTVFAGAVWRLNGDE